MMSSYPLKSNDSTALGNSGSRCRYRRWTPGKRCRNVVWILCRSSAGGMLPGRWMSVKRSASGYSSQIASSTFSPPRYRTNQSWTLAPSRDGGCTPAANQRARLTRLVVTPRASDQGDDRPADGSRQASRHRALRARACPEVARPAALLDVPRVGRPGGDPGDPRRAAAADPIDPMRRRVPFPSRTTGAAGFADASVLRHLSRDLLLASGPLARAVGGHLARCQPSRSARKLSLEPPGVLPARRRPPSPERGGADRALPVLAPRAFGASGHRPLPLPGDPPRGGPRLPACHGLRGGGVSPRARSSCAIPGRGGKHQAAQEPFPAGAPGLGATRSDCPRRGIWSQGEPGLSGFIDRDAF